MLMISTTTLSAEVRQALLEKGLTDEEFRALYASFLDLQAKRMTGVKVAALILGVLLLIMPIMSLLSPVGTQNTTVLLISTVMNIPIFVGILFLVYYLVFGRLKQQFMAAASIHYADLLKEKVTSKN